MPESLEVLEELELGGWEVEISSDRIIVRGRPLTDELREKIRENKELILNYHRDKKTQEIIESFRRVFEGKIEVLPPDTKERKCYACGGSLFWISRYNGYLYCATCHPPADPDAVAGWLGRELELEEIEEPKGDVVQGDYQKPICKWCKAGKSLDCQDCKRRR